MSDELLVFSHLLDPNPRYYVYIHVDRNGIPFYVGKGTGRRFRVTRHRNTKWWMLAARGWEARIIYDNLTEEQAICEEMRLIEHLKRSGLPNANILLGANYISEKDRATINKRRAQSCSQAWQTGRFKRRPYIGSENPFFGKRHSEQTRERLRQAHYHPISCQHDGEQFIVCGTRRAAHLSKLSRPTVQRAIKTGVPTKTGWTFKRVLE